MTKVPDLEALFAAAPTLPPGFDPFQVIQFVHRIPNYVAREKDPEPLEFASTEVLLKYLQPLAERTQTFSHWALGSGDYVLLVSDEGFHWWAVGRVTRGLSLVDLPAWGGSRYRLRDTDGSLKIVEGAETAGSQGGWVRLRDGTSLPEWKGPLPGGLS